MREQPETCRLTVLGSTGSIGTQTLEVISRFPEKLRVVALAAGRSVDLLIQQCKHSGRSSSRSPARRTRDSCARRSVSRARASCRAPRACARSPRTRPIS